jgi:hypothetical protein
MASIIDTSKFETFRSKADGSMYYGNIAYLDRTTNLVIEEAERAKLSPVQLTEGYEKVRHGYGLQIYNGQRNSDGILTKYEGVWQNNKKHGNGFVIYSDGSTY